MADWNPAQYLAFANERARPARDLIARLPHPAPRKIVDLGCGPGNSTALLRAAYPAAEIRGVDSSPAMLAKARAAVPDVQFELADVATISLEHDVDVIFSNALFHWLPEHTKVMQRLLDGLKPGAVLAVQMPDNLAEPSHALMAEVAKIGPWKSKLEQEDTSRTSLLTATGYGNALQPHCTTFDLWRTTYYHRLASHVAIADMLSSTGLKPWLDPLDDAERATFRSAYLELIKPHYPCTDDGEVLYPFPRLFMLCVK